MNKVRRKKKLGWNGRRMRIADVMHRKNRSAGGNVTDKAVVV